TLPLVTFLSWQMPRPFVRWLLDGTMVVGRNTERATRDAALLQEWEADLATGDVERERIMLLQLEAHLRRLALDYAAAPENQPVPPANAPVPGLWAGDLGRVEKMMAFMAENYAVALQVGDIAAAAGVHPNYAMNLFRREFGMSLGDFLTRYRVSHAQRLLATTDNSVLDIAFACGFGSLSRFHAAFKATCGASPAQYRRSLRTAGHF
ncbi:MAG: helix-turn-helix domain-containing protein, partial [Armatimonadota bacterium]|nr:helix-turn-helix domain-containing protein [Armatimonadota bacterium]